MALIESIECVQLGQRTGTPILRCRMLAFVMRIDNGPRVSLNDISMLSDAAPYTITRPARLFAAGLKLTPFLQNSALH